MNRAPALLAAGQAAMIAGGSVLVALLLVRADSWIRWVGVGAAVIAALSTLSALRLGLRPPIVVRLDADGLHPARSPAAAWLDVDDVTVGRGIIALNSGEDDPVLVPLELVEPDRRDELVREIYDRLNQANGYRRFQLG